MTINYLFYCFVWPRTPGRNKGFFSPYSCWKLELLCFLYNNTLRNGNLRHYCFPKSCAIVGVASTPVLYREDKEWRVCFCCDASFLRSASFCHGRVSLIRLYSVVPSLRSYRSRTIDSTWIYLSWFSRSPLLIDLYLIFCFQKNLFFDFSIDKSVVGLSDEMFLICKCSHLLLFILF